MSTIEVLHVEVRDLSRIRIETERLIIRALSIRDERSYQELYSNEEVMLRYADGKLRTADRVSNMINVNIKRWLSGNPFSCMTIELKENRKFIGSIFVSTFDRLDGTGLLGYLFFPEYWRYGYATESVEAIIYNYLPKVNKGQYLEKISAVYAYAKLDNIASLKILERVGFKKQKVVEKFGSERFEYILSLEDK